MSATAARTLSPQRQRQRTLEVLIEQLAGLARERPVLELYEDVHWMDPSTLELLDLLVARARSLPVLVVLTYRSEFDPPWTGQSHVTALTMNRLGRRQGAALIERVTGGKPLPSEILDQILAKTDGVPLFVEELTRTVLESGLLTDAGDHYELAGSLPPLAIPATLQDSLMARLDRLAPVKEVAQTAAVIGRTFGFELLAAVSSMDGRALEDALLQLEAAELVYRRGVAPDIAYDFKHALVQDVAYQSLLKGRRQQQHARIAEVLLEQFPANADNEPEVVAHHYTAAGLAGPAADQWLKAGRRAMQRSANVEAERHLRKGLEVLQAMPEGPERRRREIALQNTLGVCLMPTRGFGSPDVAEAFSRAASISEEEGDARGLFVALRGKGQYQMISGDLGTAREQASRILSLAKELDDPGVVIEAHHLGWSALTFTGDFGVARRHAETVIDLYDRDRHHGLTYIYSGHDPGVCSRSFGSLALWQLGYPDQALAMCRDGERLAHEVAHPFSTTVALWASGMLYLLRRETDATLETGEALIAHCSEKGFPPFIPLGRIFRGGALAEQGELSAGIAELGEGIAGLRASGTEYTLPLFFAWLAEICGEGGRLDEGLATIEGGRALSEETEDRFSLPEFDRLEGEILLARSAHNRAEAQACFERAIHLARAQDARSLELRAATSLARLWGEGGDGPKLEISSHRSTTGSPRGSTPPTSRMPRRCLRSCRDGGCRRAHLQPDCHGRSRAGGGMR
jgi:predicted ATPase